MESQKTPAGSVMAADTKNDTKPDEAVPRLLATMVGTAGHVDHGKTSLVRALTDFETDTLKEEKERGLTIDFGVAPCTMEINGESRTFGIIDVPGHSDFIRNTVAGAASIDLMLLVVAADDSLMPQTVEHLKIAAHLGLRDLIVVVSKIDLVDEETLALVEEELEEFLEEQAFENVRTYRVSSINGTGLAELRLGISERLTALGEQEESPAAFRMFVRKAFTMKGHGTVVTGVPDRGRLSLNDKLLLIPSGKRTGIRGLQNYRSEQNTIGAHVSTAINVRDLSPEDFERGKALVAPDSFQQSRSAIITFENSTEELQFAKRQKFRMHIGTSALVVDVRSLGASGIRAGERGLLVVRFREQQTFIIGDRFVLRSLSPAETIGGGRILSLRPGFSEETQRGVAQLEAAAAQLEAGNAAFAAALAAPGIIFRMEDIALQCGIALEDCKRKISQRPQPLDPAEGDQEENVDQASIPRISKLDADSYLIEAKGSDLTRTLHRRLRSYHRANPLSQGMKSGYAAELLGVPSKHFDTVWKALASNDEISYRSGVLALAGFAPQISERESQVRESLLAALAESENKALAKGPLFDSLNVSDKEGRRQIKLLGDSGEIQMFGSTLMLRRALDAIEQQVIELFSRNPQLELGDFRKATGLGRNLAVEVLEHFDARGLTKRQGSFRVLNRKAD